VILSTCPKLERLVLSGCGNTVPPTCPRFDCEALRLKRLRLLFFADGDDFSWDHDLPPCFWRATLGAGRLLCTALPHCVRSGCIRTGLGWAERGLCPEDADIFFNSFISNQNYFDSIS
jgi:hypothetical protein